MLFMENKLLPQRIRGKKSRAPCGEKGKWFSLPSGWALYEIWRYIVFNSFKEPRDQETYEADVAERTIDASDSISWTPNKWITEDKANM